MNVKSASDTQLCLFTQQSTETPKLLKGHRRRTAGEQMGGSPKASTTASGKGNQPAGGDPESNRGCPGPMTSRGETNTLDTEPGQGPVSTKVQSSWGNGRSRAQWEKNLTCFEVILQANRHAQVPASLSTTRATQLQTVAHQDTLGTPDTLHRRNVTQRCATQKLAGTTASAPCGSPCGPTPSGRVVDVTPVHSCRSSGLAV